MSDTTTGLKEEISNGSAIIDASESATVVDGMAMQMLSTGYVKIWTTGTPYCGAARIITGTDAGVASAVKGDRIGLLHKGEHEVYDSEDTVLALGQPIKPTGTTGKYGLWVGGTDYADTLAGYVDRTKDADAKIIMRHVGGI